MYKPNSEHLNECVNECIHLYLHSLAQLGSSKIHVSSVLSGTNTMLPPPIVLSSLKPPYGVGWTEKEYLAQRYPKSIFGAENGF